MSSCSVGLLFGSLLGAVLLYISLSSSNSREDESGKTLEAWTKQATPFIGLNAIAGFLGIIFFYLVDTFHTNGSSIYNPGTLYLINNLGNFFLFSFVIIFGAQGVRMYSKTNKVMVVLAEGQAIENPTLDAEGKRDEIES